MRTNWEIKALVIVNLLLGAAQATAMPVAPYSSPNDDYEQATLVTKDDRVKRTPYSLGRLEESQGRIWCFQPKKLPPTNSPSASYVLKNWYSVANASLILENDIVLLNRHAFTDENAKFDVKPENCFFEHLATGEFIRGTKKLVYPFVRDNLDRRDVNRTENDVALWRLEHGPSKSDLRILVKDDVLLEHDPKYYEPLTVVSNYAENLPPNQKLDSTITYCQAMHGISDKHGLTAYEFKTDCNTGHGSSGSLVFTEVMGSRKLIGIIRGETTKTKPGSGYDVDKLHTSVLRFQQNFFDLYDELKKLDQSETTER